jgi:site-specific recombinase XerD
MPIERKISDMLTPWRRHLQKCPHRGKGRDHVKCNCPIWADGELNGKRYRKSLGLRDWQRAIRKLAALEAPDAIQWKPLKDAIETFFQHHANLEASTVRKYRNVLDHLQEFATARKIEALCEFTIDQLDAYRASRKLSSTTSTKELQTLRQFFGFCVRRKWIAENLAKDIDPPKNARPKDVVPYTTAEIAKIIGASDQIGRTSYERLRARAMVLLLRYTALAVSDVATLERNRVHDGQILVRRKKTGGLVYLPVPKPLQDALDVLPPPRAAVDEPKHFFWNDVTMSRRCVVGGAERTLAAVFNRAEVAGAHAHRFRHTLATEMLGLGATFEEVSDVLGNSAKVVEKHYAKWSRKRQERIWSLMEALHFGTPVAHKEKGPVTH